MCLHIFTLNNLKIHPFAGPGVEIEDVTEEMDKKGADDTGPVSFFLF